MGLGTEDYATSLQYFPKVVAVLQSGDVLEFHDNTLVVAVPLGHVS